MKKAIKIITTLALLYGGWWLIMNLLLWALK